MRFAHPPLLELSSILAVWCGEHDKKDHMFMSSRIGTGGGNISFVQNCHLST